MRWRVYNHNYSKSYKKNNYTTEWRVKTQSRLKTPFACTVDWHFLQTWVSNLSSVSWNPKNSHTGVSCSCLSSPPASFSTEHMVLYLTHLCIRSTTLYGILCQCLICTTSFQDIFMTQSDPINISFNDIRFILWTASKQSPPAQCVFAWVHVYVSRYVHQSRCICDCVCLSRLWLLCCSRVCRLCQ